MISWIHPTTWIQPFGGFSGPSRRLIAAVIRKRNFLLGSWGPLLLSDSWFYLSSSDIQRCPSPPVPSSTPSRPDHWDKLAFGPATSPFPPSGPCRSASCFSRHPVGARPQSGVEIAFPVGATSVRLPVSPRHAHRAPSLPTWQSRSRPGVGGVRGAPSAAGPPGLGNLCCLLSDGAGFLLLSALLSAHCHGSVQTPHGVCSSSFLLASEGLIVTTLCPALTPLFMATGCQERVHRQEKGTGTL